MTAATLPLSRSMRIPLATRQNTNDSMSITDEWGPSSVPPTTQSNIPWDEDQAVPALRKKLEAESKDLGKRISRIQESDNGWAGLRGPLDRRDTRAVSHALDKRLSREVVQHHRESSIDQFHNRFASVRTPSRQQSRDAVSTSFPFDLADSHDSNAKAGSVASNDATARAREKARQIAAARQKTNQHQNGGSRYSNMSSTEIYGGTTKQGLQSGIDAIPEGQAVVGDAGQSFSSAFQSKRLRTQSTPMRPSLDVIDPDHAASSRRAPNPSSQESRELSPSINNSSKQANGHQRSNSLSRRKAAMDPKLMEEFGPLGATPSPTAKLLRAHQEFNPASSCSPSSLNARNRNIQPDAFRSLSKPDQPRYRESSAPPAFGQDGDTSINEFGASPGSKSVSSWEDQIIPTVARKLQQEQFLKAAKEGRLSRYEGLIDTWDKNGLPLSRSDVMAMQRAKKLQEEQGQAEKQQQQQQDEEEGEVEEGDGEQMLIPGPAPPMQHRSSNLSPIEAGFNERSRSRASSRRSQRSARSHQQVQPQPQLQLQSQQYPPDQVAMQTFESPRSVVQPTSQPPLAAPSASAVQLPHSKTNAQHDDKVDKGGCCCIVM